MNITGPNKTWVRYAIVFIPCIAGLLLFALVLQKYTNFFGSPFDGLTGGKKLTQEVIDSKAALGQFGDYLGGFLNPIIALFSLLALSLTLLMQSRQLEQASVSSNKQLEMAKEEKDFNEAIALASHWTQLSENYDKLSKLDYVSPSGGYSTFHPKKKEYEEKSKIYMQRFEALAQILEKRHEQLVEKFGDQQK